MKKAITIFWFRRDLRLIDNAGLFHALKHSKNVLPVFVFDTIILDKLEDKTDKRVTFIHAALEDIQKKLIESGSSLEVFHDTPEKAFSQLIDKYVIDSVFTNHDYEAYAIERDQLIKDLLSKNGIRFLTFKDHVIFEKNEIIKADGKPYTVFTPYNARWTALLNDFYVSQYPCEKYHQNFIRVAPKHLPSLSQLGFEKVAEVFPDPDVDEDLINDYASRRDFPGMRGTSKLGVHLRFGTVSIRRVANKARSISAIFLKELAWRDFYQMILFHFPQIGGGKSFKPAYDNIDWRRDEGEFEKWCTGQTGYPLVDAGMRELNETGFMHNRIRMVTASFLCKHLLLDWRLGEAYFAEKLLDFDFASNNGGWQWASGSGCDSAPYFRIFNPTLQMKKFDPDFSYVRRWVPEFQEFTYPPPIVNHEFARKRCLEAYAKALKPALR